MRRVRRRLAAAALVTLVGGAAEGGGDRGFRGFLAVQGDRIVETRQADRLFVPGSVIKLVVTAAALHHLGPEHRVTTALDSAGSLDGGTLQGDLVVRAAADPTWDERFFPEEPRSPLVALAEQLRSRGVAVVTGDLVVDVSRFPGPGQPPSRALSEVGYGYGAASSALAIDGNTVRLEVAPAGIGEPVRVLDGGGLTIVNRSWTVSAERHGRGTLEVLPLWGQGAVVLRGEYPSSEPPYTIEVAAPDPTRRAGAALLRALVEAGVRVAGKVRVSREPPPPGRRLAAVRSPPLGRWMETILGDSHNWTAEMLLRVLAAEESGEGRAEAGLAIGLRFLETVVGAPPGSVVLDDASGLSPYNLMSPEAVVALLRFAQRQPWADVWVEGLPGRGEGTLAVWGALPPLRAKSGTLRHAVALAGYLRPAGSAPIPFAYFLQNRPEERWQLRAEIARDLHRWSAETRSP